MENAVVQETAADGEKRWSALTASLTGWLLPATAAKRSAHLPLWAAFAAHVAAAVLLVLFCLVLVAWSESHDFQEFPSELLNLFAGALEELDRRPREFFLILAAVIVGVEIGYLGSALVLMAWGAADEPVRSSFASALRQLWLHTAHLLVALLMVGPLAISLEHVHDEEIIGYACFAAATWILWSLLRAIGAARRTPPMVRPPTCESCGYNLTGTAADSRCPECGQPVVASLGPEVRPGSVWQRRHEVGWWRAWWRCNVDAIVRPHWFGRQLKVADPGMDHRLFLALHLVPIFVIGAAGIILCYIAATGRNPFERGGEIVWIVGPVVGYFTSVSMFFMAPAGAGLVALGYRAGQKRNLMAASMQVASYLGGYLTLWAVLAVVVGITEFAFEDSFRALRRTIFTYHEMLMLAAWLLVNLGCSALYVLLVWRGTAGARYANR